jgi:hypothetical protein
VTDDAWPPLYARVLRLRHVRPSGLLCFLFFEAMVALGVLLALAELVSWWAVPVLPAVVAGMVKLNDLIAGGPGTCPEPAGARPPVAGGPVAGGSGKTGARIDPVPGEPARESRPVSRALVDRLDPADSLRQRFRQSARRRYR